jgi:hypothetical protein
MILSAAPSCLETKCSFLSDCVSVYRFPTLIPQAFERRIVCLGGVYSVCSVYFRTRIRGDSLVKFDISSAIGRKGYRTAFEEQGRNNIATEGLTYYVHDY